MITRNRVKKILLEAAAVEGMHTTVLGELVPFGCPECVDDLEYRIIDMTDIRDSCPRSSASRVHYNGVLNDLRQKRRSAIKIGSHLAERKSR
tara:strand:+ start:858 stop:1133 length:276 start_codon:yes stop_codon:yes gene_type:complete